MRKEKGLSQQQLAEAIGSHLVTISKLERGKMKFTYEWAAKIAEALNVPTVMIYGSEAADRSIKISGLLTETGRINLEAGYLDFPDMSVDVYFKDSIHSIWMYVDTADLYPFLQYGDILRVEKMDIINDRRYLNRLCIVKEKLSSRYAMGVLHWNPKTWKFDADCFNSAPMRDVDLSEVWLVTMVVPFPDAGGQIDPTPTDKLSFDRTLRTKNET